MAIPKPIKGAAGSYSGESTLHMSWMPEGQQLEKGPSKMHIEFDRHMKYATVTYTWKYKDTEQEGTILIAGDEDGKDVTMGWSDSWHMGAGVMYVKGEVKDGEINCRGKYAAPPGPDWGWRITFSTEGDSLTMKMYNATPKGEEMIAVDAVYKKD